jgi:hypothetical protein
MRYAMRCDAMREEDRVDLVCLCCRREVMVLDVGFGVVVGVVGWMLLEVMKT